MTKLLDIFRKYALLRTLFFKAFKNFSYFNRAYHDKVLHKPKSKEIFADAVMPTGAIRAKILKGLGIPEKELRKKPFVAVCNSFCEINPGHKHLRQLAEAVKAGIYAGGGIPFEFGVPGPCDGLANGNEGMQYILPQRDLIADVIEMYVKSQWFDGMVTLSSCDKINPAMLMVIARLNIPALCVTGGPNIMKARFSPNYKGIDHKNYERLSDKLLTCTAATCGSCELVTTANTIQMLMEVLGLALPYSSCCPAFVSEKMEFAFQSGVRAVEMIKENLLPSRILTKDAFENAVMMSLAIGGSTNTCLHLPAIAKEAGVHLPLEIFNRFNEKIPTLCGIAPNGPYGVYDLFTAGGIPAVMKRLKDDLHTECLTCTGETIGEILKHAEIKDKRMITTKEKPFLKEGGIAILSGNLAPEGAVVKQSAVKKEMRVFTGKARVFDSEAECLSAITKNAIKDGACIVIRYEGPKGGPGMPEMLTVTSLIEMLGLEKTALVTDGRFSGATSGPCVGHVSPEAYDGGLIALLKDGDEIYVNIPERKIEAKLTEEEIKKRRAAWLRVEKEVHGYAKRYRDKVQCASQGAVLA